MGREGRRRYQTDGEAFNLTCAVLSIDPKSIRTPRGVAGGLMGGGWPGGGDSLDQWAIVGSRSPFNETDLWGSFSKERSFDLSSCMKMLRIREVSSFGSVQVFYLFLNKNRMSRGCGCIFKAFVEVVGRFYLIINFIKVCIEKGYIFFILKGTRNFSE